MTLLEKKKQIYDALAKLSVLYDKPPSQTRLKAYVEVLKDYPMSSIAFSIQKAQRGSFVFPSLAWLIQQIDSTQDERSAALQMAGEIIESISRFGNYQAKDARKFLGEESWLVVERFGGWNLLCNLSYKELNTARAQLRDLCKSILETKGKPLQSITNSTEKRTLKRLENVLQLTQGEKDD